MGPGAVEENLLNVDQMLENFMRGKFYQGGNQSSTNGGRAHGHPQVGWVMASKFEGKFFAPRLPQNWQGGGKMLERVANPSCTHVPRLIAMTPLYPGARCRVERGSPCCASKARPSNPSSTPTLPRAVEAETGRGASRGESLPLLVTHISS